MALGPRLELKTSQTLQLTPQLVQSIKLLQLNNLELAAFLEQEMEKNPFLDQDDQQDALTEEASPQESLQSLHEDSEFEQSFSAEFQDGSAPSGLEGAAEPWLAETLTTSSSLEMAQDMGTELDNVFETHENDDTWLHNLSRQGAVLPQDMSQSDPAEAWDWDRLGHPDTTLAEHLQGQLRLCDIPKNTQKIADYIIGLLDEAGYLREPLGQIALALGADNNDVEAALACVQSLEPTGVGARDLAECLALQLREKNRLDPAMAKLLENLDQLMARDHTRLQRLCGVDAEDFADMLTELRQLNPKPGARFAEGRTGVTEPDVIVREAHDGSWCVEMNEDLLPRVLVNQSFVATVDRKNLTAQDKSYLSEALQSAHWLVRAMESRAKTILKVATEMVRYQDAFLSHGVAYLRPLTLRQLAENVGLHESTVSRVTAHKTILTPRGLFEMRFFFTNAVGEDGEGQAAESIRWHIKELIDAEAPTRILSDDALVHKLKERGIEVARRTVAKYREAMNIPSSVERRRLKALRKS